MEDDDETGPVDLTGSDILPPLAQSTNPLFPNAIVKRPPNTHAKGGGKNGPRASTGAGAAAAAGAGANAGTGTEDKEDGEPLGPNSSIGQSPQTKPYGIKYTPVS